MFVPTNALGVPRAGVTRVGDVAKTNDPVPVSSVTAASKLADVNEPNDVALPTEVIAPVRLAFVVTFPEVSPAAVPVMFVPTNADGVPRAGVTKVGLLANTKAPDPVSSETAEARLADDGVAKNVATPAPNPLTPVDIGSPVALVNVADVGVPRAGVTSVGEFDNTLLPVPVLVPTPVPPLVTFSNGPASNNASIKSRSALTLVPQVFELAPTSGLVSNRFVVVVSAIF
jgi:hypothetical protein